MEKPTPQELEARRVKTLEYSASTAQAECASLRKQVASLQSVKDEIANLRAEHATEIEQLKQSLELSRASCATKDAEIKQLKESLRAKNEAPSKLAAEIVASCMHRPVAIAPGAPSASGEKSLLEQYNELVATNPKAAGEFYAKHANQIFTGQKDA